MAAQDEIWRPGYDGPAPVSGVTTFERGAFPHDDPPVRERGRWRFAPAMIAVAGFASAAVVAWLLAAGPELKGASRAAPAIAEFTTITPLRLTDEAPTSISGGGPRRLPTAVSPRWSTALAPLVADGGANATTWVHAADSRYIVVGIGDARALSGPSAVVVLDASTGQRQWVKQLETRIDQVEFIAAIGDALVMTIGTEIVSLDLDSGEQLWTDQLMDVNGPAERIERLDGTDLLGVLGPDPDGSIRLVDPNTGRVVSEMIGRILGTDRSGRWHVLRGDKVLEFDLSRRDIDPSNDGEPSPIHPDVVASVDADRSRATAIVDGSLVSTVDAMLAFGPLDVDGEQPVGPSGLTPLTVAAQTAESMTVVDGILPLGGPAFAVVGRGTITGAEVQDGAIRVAWRRRGVITTSFATESGVLLLVGTDGGAAQTLVDGATGEPIATLTMSPGVFDALEVVGNGFVTRRTGADGSHIAGLDLAGNELWTLDGSAAVSVGEGIVVRSIPQSDGSFEVTAYGDPVE